MRDAKDADERTARKIMKFLMQNNINDFLNFIGLNVNINDTALPPIVFLAIGCLIFNCIILFSVINISIYLLSLYIVNNNKIFDKISNSVLRAYMTKLVKFYNRTRVSFIILELIFLFSSIGYMLKASIKIIIHFS